MTAGTNTITKLNIYSKIYIYIDNWLNMLYDDDDDDDDNDDDDDYYYYVENCCNISRKLDHKHE